MSDECECTSCRSAVVPLTPTERQTALDRVLAEDSVAKAIAEAEAQWYGHPCQYDEAPEMYLWLARAALAAGARP